MTLLTMYEELLFLFDRYKDILADKCLYGSRLHYKFFNYLVAKYYKKDHRFRASFILATNLSKTSFELLTGQKICGTTIRKICVIYAMFWLMPSYEEAKLLFLLWFNNQLDEGEFQKWDSILFELEKNRNYLLGKEELVRVDYAREKVEKLKLAKNESGT